MSSEQAFVRHGNSHSIEALERSVASDASRKLYRQMLDLCKWIDGNSQRVAPNLHLVVGQSTFQTQCAWRGS